eukprot:TRINITY_DN90919_c0_g1_i1.p1 TRINITY_DN90919_c0_g1~~TRINITY_DN90919_c0_g1_i1.p1  ORF type:complete len:560 (-),score=74.14 TRINITY_DN90919_c0_g1_i1:215-1810(-)
MAAAFPGPEHLHPAIHFAPSYVSEQGGWHDIAGALTHKGVHHIYQGTGWNHAFSSDLVHWTAGAHGPSAIQETHAGMDSKSDPCSGFLTKDPNGTVCAGFRQCGSNKGVAGGHPWDVPLELRCALDDDMQAWSETPNYLFNVSWYRAIPYDPARPWVEKDGYWYQLLSMDGCNATTQKLPCDLGGQLHLWRSPALQGPRANWEHIGPVFTSAATPLKGTRLTKEFVTIDYVGKLSGDPSPNDDTRVFFDNVGGNGGGEGCCSGTTSFRIVAQASPGAPMVEVGQEGMVDWGAFSPLPSAPSGASGVGRLSGTASRGLSMARTLGSEDADQVTQPGRRVMIGWTGPSPLQALLNQGSAQSLPRELSLGPDRSLRQRFVPELQSLRSQHFTTPVNAGLQAEIFASFGPRAETSSDFGLSVLGGGSLGGSTQIALSPSTGLVLVNGTSQGNPQVRAGPLPPASPEGWNIHAVIDHCILEVIVNNVTALVVYVAPSPDSGHVELFSGDAQSSSVDKLDVWTLKSAKHGHVMPIVV